MRYIRSPRFGTRIATVLVAGAFALFAGPLHADAASDAAAVKSLVNGERASAGLGSLAGSGGLDQVARAQAQRMADRDAIYHNPNLGSDADAAGVNWTLIGENVGVGEDVNSVHDAFMASPGHKANIVHRDYTVIGTGVAIGKDGSVFVAQVFARVQGSSASTKAAAPAPAKVAPKAATPAPAVVAALEETPQPTTSVSAAPVATAPVAPADPTSPNALIGGIVNGA